CRAFFGYGFLKVKFGANTETAFFIPASAMWHQLEFRVDCENNRYEFLFNGNEFEYNGLYRFVNKVNDVQRLVIRTKPARHFPNYDDYPDTPDIPEADEPVTERVYFIRDVRTGEW
ncbi:MAG: hypothetical protein FWF05_02215, partial [Oscillospiraceae bacterium]|nr:hypothetical protein [Oscillospiraceae bacterium]